MDSGLAPGNGSVDCAAAPTSLPPDTITGLLKALEKVVQASGRLNQTVISTLREFSKRGGSPVMNRVIQTLSRRSQSPADETRPRAFSRCALPTRARCLSAPASLHPFPSPAPSLLPEIEIIE